MKKLTQETDRITEADHDLWKNEDIDYKDIVGHLRGDQEFNGPLEKRKCTNVGFLIFFIISNCLLITSAVFIFLSGNPSSLTKGYDIRGRVCGIKELENKKFMLYPNSTTLDWSLCVESCPYYYYANYYCIYDRYNPSVTYPEWGCYDAYQTTAFGFYCLPIESKPREAVLNYLQETMQVFKRSSGDLLLSWDLIMFGCLFSIILGFSYLFLFRKAKIIKWVVLLSIWGVGGLLSFLVYLLLEASNRSYSQLCDNYGPSVPQYCDHSTQNVYLACAYAVGVLGGLYIYRVIGKYKEFSVGIEMIELTCKPLHVIKELLLFPFIQIFVGLGFLLLLAMLLVWTISAGSLKKINSPNVPGGVAYKIEYTALQDYILLYNIALAIWWINFLTDLGDYVLAGGVATWYFSRQKSILYVFFT